MRRTAGASAALVVAAFVLAACASESHQVVETPTVDSAGTPWAGPRPAVAIGNFQNRSPYMQGMFTSGEDRLGSQAQTILKTHLSQSNRFQLLDRDNMDAIARESELSGTAQALAGANFVLSGEVTEFGRRNTGDRELFGILGRGHNQMAYSKVSINVVDARTSQVVHSVQGAGEYALSDREVVGFGSTSGYDSTLNGKVLNLAITDAVNKLVASVEAGAWGR
jgi:curli biogenesis system outer membrane secretion channel CsgG